MSKINVPIHNKLASLVEAKARSWNEVAQILEDVEKSGHWKSEAPSFSQWVTKFAVDLKIGETSLWRFRAGLRILQNLRNGLLNDGRSCPELEVIAKKTNPQNLELFEKLTRVLPDNEARELGIQVLEGEASRDHLRRLWEIYRPLLGGKTARGHGVERPTYHDEYKKRTALQVRALALAAISASNDWLDDPHQHCKTFISVKVPVASKNEIDVILDAVVLARSSVSTELEIHAIEIIESWQSPKQMLAVYRQKASFSHFFWFASVDKIHHSDDGVPVGAGLLWCHERSVTVTNKAVQTNASRIKDTGLALLEVLYKR